MAGEFISFIRRPAGTFIMAILFTLSNAAFAAVAVHLAVIYDRDGQPRMATASIVMAAILAALATWAACDLIRSMAL